MCPDFFPGCCLSGHCCSHSASILTCVCTLRLSRTRSAGVGMFHRPLRKAVTHYWYIVPNICKNLSICPSSFPQAYNAFKWLKLFNRSTYLINRAWLYPRVNDANTVHLSKHHSYCLQSQNRRCKDRSLECHLIIDDHDKWITNTTTPQYAYIIPWCQWTQSLKVLLFFFSGSVYLKMESIQNLNVIGPLVSEIWIFKINFNMQYSKYSMCTRFFLYLFQDMYNNFKYGFQNK